MVRGSLRVGVLPYVVAVSSSQPIEFVYIINGRGEGARALELRS
jgi:hypothetical protein